MEEYFVLYCSEDGEHYLQKMTKPELEKALADEEWGYDVKINMGLPSGVGNLESTTGLFIFKGSLIVPKPKTVVRAWSV
jgi:hypothetical protein